MMPSQSRAIVPAQSARPLRHWPDASLARASGSLEHAWRDWCARWQLTAASVVASNACDDATAAESATWPWTAGGPLWLSVGPADIHQALATLLFDADSHHHAPIARALASDALADLLRSLGQLAAGSDMPLGGASGPPPAVDLRRWSGAIRASLVALRGDRPMRLQLQCCEPLAAVLCGGVQPGSSVGRPPLMEVTQALAARRLAFRVFLDEATLTLGTLQSLQVGDVLPLSHRLDQPLRVAIAGAARWTPDFCAAFLGSRNHRRAVELVPAASASPSTAS